MKMTSMENDILISLITRERIHAPTVKWLLEQPCSVDIICAPYTIEHQRNTQVRRFLKSNKEWLLIIDDDALPIRETLIGLWLAATVDEKGKYIHVAPQWGGWFGREDRVLPLAYIRGDEDEYYPLEERRGTFTVDLCGMSGALIPRKLLEEMPSPWFKTRHEDGVMITTEDIYFYKKAQKMGYVIRAHLDLLSEHLKVSRIGQYNQLD